MVGCAGWEEDAMALHSEGSGYQDAEERPGKECSYEQAGKLKAFEIHYLHTDLMHTYLSFEPN